MSRISTISRISETDNRPGERHPRCGRTCGGVWPLGVLACAVVACNAQIVRFDVGPRHVCAGQAVHIAWEVKGSARLRIDPEIPGAPDGDVASAGHATIRPTSNTRVFLRVTRWPGDPTGGDVDVTLPAPVEIAADLQDSPSCMDGVLTLQTEAKGFADGVKAGLVSAHKRALDVRRVDAAGHVIAAQVTPGGSATAAFAALPVNGRWTLSSRLDPGESCSNPPHVLTAIVQPACKEATP